MKFGMPVSIPIPINTKAFNNLVFLRSPEKNRYVPISKWMHQLYNKNNNIAVAYVFGLMDAIDQEVR